MTRKIRIQTSHILVLSVGVTQLYFHWTNLKGKNSYSIGGMVHYKNWKRQTKCYYDHKQIHKIHKISDNPWKNRRKITRPWSDHTFIPRHSTPICSFLWPSKVIHSTLSVLRFFVHFQSSYAMCTYLRIFPWNHNVQF